LATLTRKSPEKIDFEQKVETTSLEGKVQELMKKRLKTRRQFMVWNTAASGFLTKILMKNPSKY